MDRRAALSIVLLAAVPASAQIGELSRPMRARVTITSRVTYPIDRALMTTDQAAYEAGSNWRDAACATPARYNHTGLDLDAPEGTPVFAAAAGTLDGSVSSCPGPDSEDSSCVGYGNYVKLSHGGYSTLYAHLLEGSIPPLGDNVECGQFLGIMGNTGNSDGSHLHFEVRLPGDPRPALDAEGGMCALQVADTTMYNEVALWTDATCEVGDIAGYFGQVDYESTTDIGAAPNADFAAVLIYRNIGSLAWEPGVVELREQGDSGVGGVPELLPITSTVSPCSGGSGCEATFRVAGTAPAAAGDYEYRYQLFANGVPFQIAATIHLHVVAGECISGTLERNRPSDPDVPVGICVQRDPASAGTGGNCDWFVCARPGSSAGGFDAIEQAACGGASVPNAGCDCATRTECNTCADGAQCAWHDGRCVARASAPDGAILEAGLCDACPAGAYVCTDSTMRAICEGDIGLRVCGESLYEICVCRVGGLAECAPCGAS